MHECLRCGQGCGTALFCELCQTSLLQRSRQGEQTLFSSHVPTVQVTELEPPTTCEHTIQTASVVAMSGERHLFQRELHEQLPDILARLSDEQPVAWAASPQTERTVTPILDKRDTAVPGTRLRYLRRAFIGMALLVIAALIVDCVLVSLVFTRHKERVARTATQPMVTFTPGMVYPGQIAQLHLQHFAPSARVLLRRNVDEQIRLDTDNSLVRVNSQGEANLRVLVEDDWGTGGQYIEAEDVDAHYVAGVSIQVIGSGPVRAPHLQLSQQALHMGADWQGANTLQSVTLQNTGGGRISWTAWSNQPWLMLTPMQGAFSSSQRVVIAVSRARLQAGDYTGRVTFVANTGAVIPLDVTMTVQTPQTEARALLVVMPPVLSFVVSDGAPDPQVQQLTIHNSGSQPLYWSFDHSAATIAVDQKMPLVDKMDWLEINPRSGTVPAGKNMTISVRAHSHTLWPGVYSGILTFTAGQNALNNPQSVAVSLVVQPPCGITTNISTLSFTAIADQSTPAQTLLVGLAPECSGALSWQASSLAKWLTITPDHGKVSVQNSASLTVQVRSAALEPRTYDSFLVFVSDRRTQTVAVQLTVLPPGSSQTTGQISSTGTTPTSVVPGGQHRPVASEQGLELSTLNVSYRMTQGEEDPPGQSVSLTNTSASLFYWQARADTNGQSWLKLASTTGVIPQGQTGQILLNIDGDGLQPGTYRTNLVVTATDGAGVAISGSPQTVIVTLKVVQPCTLHVTPTNLSFSATLLTGEPAAKEIVLQGVGDCMYPLAWKASVDPASQSWLSLSDYSGIDTGNGAVVSVHVRGNSTLLGFNRGQITFSATDNSGVSLHNNLQTVDVTFSVLG